MGLSVGLLRGKRTGEVHNKGGVGPRVMGPPDQAGWADAMWRAVALAQRGRRRQRAVAAAAIRWWRGSVEWGTACSNRPWV